VLLDLSQEVIEVGEGGGGEVIVEEVIEGWVER